LLAYAVSPNRGTEVGGSWRIANRLAEDGHNVELLTSDRFRAEWEHEALPDGLTITVIPRNIPGEFLTRNALGWYLRYFVFLRRSGRVAQLIHAADPVDVAHHFSWGSLAWGTPLWRVGVPTLFGPVGGASVAPTSMRRYFSRTARLLESARSAMTKALFFNQLSRKAVRHCDVLASNSETAALLHRLFKADSRVMCESTTPQAVLNLLPLPFVDRHERQVIWVGRFIPRKCPELALLVLGNLPNHRMVIVGDGPLRTQQELLAQRLGVVNRVTFTGALEWAETMDLVRRSEVMLFTSARDTFGSQLLEAGGAGTPVVGIRHQGVADFVPAEAGALVTLDELPRMAEQMAAAIEALSSESNRWADASAAARTFAERMAVGCQAAALTEVYEQMKG
jgi:glycosyltransferase involved in cell wall biosynthesis